VGRNSGKNFQELCPQIHGRSLFKTRGGRSLHRTQSGHRQIHHVVPLHRQVNLMWKWYEGKVCRSGCGRDDGVVISAIRRVAPSPAGLARRRRASPSSARAWAHSFDLMRLRPSPHGFRRCASGRRSRAANSRAGIRYWSRSGARCVTAADPRYLNLRTPHDVQVGRGSSRPHDVRPSVA
jgi:hypothetical protein